MKLKELANKFNTSLQTSYEEDEAHVLFLMSVAKVFNYRSSDYLLNKEAIITAEKLIELENILNELQKGSPIQYILGEAQFYGLTFKVNQNVLIPRPETEELVEWILEKVASNDLFLSDTKSSILDIGTGSGCIAISLKKYLPTTQVLALDIAEGALTTAKENAALNKVEIEFIRQDILADYDLGTKLSIIVSNPPYIKEDEKPTMHQNVLANEPHNALFVSNEKPLIFYEAIADFALNNLANKGLLFFEINEYLGKETLNLLKDKGFINIELKKDMQGKDRMISCIKI